MARTKQGSIVECVASQIKEIGSGAKSRPRREGLLKAARRREVDVIIVWRLDRRGRSLADLVMTLKELSELNVSRSNYSHLCGDRNCF